VLLALWSVGGPVGIWRLSQGRQPVVTQQPQNPPQQTAPTVQTPTGNDVTPQPKPVTPTPPNLPPRITGKDGAPMVLIPAGEFQMGSVDGSDDEKPVHTVYLDAFYSALWQIIM
ncbi:hypothetical protein HYR99_39535, partial [Candidatus Poribacteria bacterium]|nr:hypothetical protein [Candidatus Poribacteria bacterium]